MVDASLLHLRTDLALPPSSVPPGVPVDQPDLARENTRLRDDLRAARAERDASRLAIDSIPGLVWTAQPDGYIDFLNQWWCDYTGLTLAQAVGWGWQAAVCPEDLPGLLETWKAVLASGAPGEAIARLRRADGVDRWFLFRAVPLLDEHGTLLRWHGQTTDIEDRTRAEALLAGEKRLLQMIANGSALPPILDALCRLAEETSSGFMASILILDHAGERLWHGAAPSLPPEFTAAISGAHVGNDIGPCGTAAYVGGPVLVADIEADPRWAEYRALAAAHGLRACWSSPMISQGGKILGTFAIYSRTPGGPTREERGVVEQIISLASVAVERSLTQLALQESEERFRQLADTLPEVIWITALHPKKMLYVSPSLEQIWGLTAAALFNQPDLWMSAIHPDDRARVVDQFTRWTAGEDVSYHDVEFRIVRPDGAVRWIHERGVLHRGEDGEPFRASGISTDITDRKHAEEALRRSEAYQGEAQRLSLTGSFSWHLRTGDLMWSDETYRIYGYDAGVTPSLDLARQRLHPADVPLFERAAERARQGEPLEFGHRLRMPDGSVKHLQVVSRAILDETGELTEYVGAVRDITEQKRAERALRRARMRGLEARYAAMMEERTRLAREIHDTVLQGFNGVALLLLAAAGKVESPPEAVNGLQHVLDLAEKTLGDARRAIWDLRAPTLASDFTATLRMAGEEAVRGTALSFDFAMRGRARTVDPRSEAVALRVVQEAIANVLKHAEARRVSLRLSYRRRGVRISVRDDGRGFTVDPDFHAYGGHWGLLGMRERAGQVSGRLTVRSEPGAGTEVVLVLPTLASLLRDDI